MLAEVCSAVAIIGMTASRFAPPSVWPGELNRQAQDNILRFLRFLGVHHSHAPTFQES
jgi:hypothetical protein